MATIPIEIIIQDAESPVTPTPESGEETNIIVPDTGTISDVNNSGGIGSSAGIILPAIIAVLAIGAMVAMLVHKHRKHQNDKLSKKEKLATVASSTIAILAATVLVGNLVIPATKAASDDANNNNDEGELVVDDKITITVAREADSDEAIVSSIKNTSLATASYDFGYKVTASMAEGTTTANLYLDGDETSEYYIAPVSDGTLTDNTWGYTLSEPTEESSYLSIPLSTKPTNIVKEVAKTVEDTAVDIYYTVQIDKDMPNGTYTGELEYTISPAIEYMQDFSTLTSTEKTATLARMTEGKQYILKDNRDKNPYYISKLKDNNVWMTQNLDLDLSTEVTFTPDDTNISANWRPENSTITNGNLSPTTWPSDEQANYNPYSYDPDELYVYSSGTDADDDVYTSLADCKDHHSDCDPHNHAGNYYNWSAAVASNDTSGMTTQYEDAPNSICPAGWRLPKGPNAEVSDYNEMVNAVRVYNGILEDDLTEDCEGSCNYYKYLQDGSNKIRKSPFWLTKFGNVYRGTYSAGGFGSYNSSVVINSTNTYYFFYNNLRFVPAIASSRGTGYPVRCLVE